LFNPVDLIRKKRDGGRLSKVEIQFLISEYLKGAISDYQFAAFLMAVYFQGMDFQETTDLTSAMQYSGKVLDLSDIGKPKLDKHSTGGIGDKVSLILAPLVASCGICVPMISGRGLGHTGGTLDKLESIPNFRTDLSIRKFKAQLKKIGVAIIGQTDEIVPADRKIYALRDVTATVDSIPLISASIMSKKLAEDLDGLVLDVKFGSGAFMREYKRAKELAQTMIQIGKLSGVKVVAILTDMNSPLGEYVGNSLEVIESIEALKGRGPNDLMELVFALGEAMLEIAQINGGRRLLQEKIDSGDALNKFKEMIYYQGGSPEIVEDYTKLSVAKSRVKVLSPKSGYIQKIDNYGIGMGLVKLGGGRLKKEDSIDLSCGFRVYKKIGDYVKKGECLLEVISRHKSRATKVGKELSETFSIDQNRHPHKPLVREKITSPIPN